MQKNGFNLRCHKSKGLDSYIRENTGLVIDAYFSGTKIKWILDNVAGARDKAKKESYYLEL